MWWSALGMLIRWEGRVTAGCQYCDSWASPQPQGGEQIWELALGT